MPLFNKNKKELYKTATMTLLDLIAPSAFKINPYYIQIGEKLAKTIFILTYPRYLNTDWLSPAINIDEELDISMFIHPTNSDQILKTLTKKLAEVKSQISLQEERGMVRDPKMETAYQDIELLRDKLQQGTERFFKFGLYITIYADTLEELNKREEKVITLFESKLMYLKTAMFQQEQGFHSTSPLATDKLLVHTNLNTNPLSTTFPFISSDLSSGEGILYGINRHNNSLVLFDRFNMENSNTIVFGKSGGGKSYATKLEILRSLIFGADIIVIDPENEYQYLAESTEGLFFNISLTSQHHINPFDLPIPGDDERPEEILRSNIVNLVGLLRIMLGGLTVEEDVILDKAIAETYASRDITIESDFSKITPPLLEDLETVLKSIEGGESLSLKLQKYTQGTFSGFLNKPTNINMNNRLVVFNVRDMEEELRPIAMYVILHYVWNIVRSKLKKRLLFVDEAWWLMKYEEGASFLFGIAKRARKYYLGVTTITQDVSDFMESKYGKPIVANSSIQIIFKQSPATINSIVDAFNLTQEEKYLLLQSSVGEGLFFAGLKHVAIQVVASYTEDQIITSDPEEILKIEEAKKEFAESLKNDSSAQK
jgi:conjugal transfer ATP-binding protein TraC